MDFGVVAKQRTHAVLGGPAKAVKVLVILNWFSAQVAHLGAAFAGHLIATVSLEKWPLTLPTLPNHGFAHLVFDVGSFPDLCVFLNLVTS